MLAVAKLVKRMFGTQDRSEKNRQKLVSEKCLGRLIRSGHFNVSSATAHRSGLPRLETFVDYHGNADSEIE